MFDLLRYAYEDLKFMDNVKIEKMKRDSKILKLQQENEHYKYILTEFEKWLIKTYYLYVPDISQNSTVKRIYDKLQELKEGKK